ncbi:MAG: DUF6044 family protein [Flavobacteriales bacterium]
MKKKHHFVYFIILSLYFLPYFILGKNFPLDVFDNMNSNIVWIKMVIENWQLMFSPHSPVPNLLGGESSFSSLYPNLDISTIPLAIFGSYWGFILDKLIMSIVGYFGILGVFRSLFPLKNENIKWLLALSFSLIPFWGFSLNAIGLPLLFHALTRIFQNKDHFRHWIWIPIFAFYSNLVLIGIFSLLLCLYVLIKSTIQTRKIHWKFILACSLLSVSYLLSHYPLIYSFLFVKDYTSHRVEMVIFDMPLNETLDYLWDIIYRGDFSYHGKKYYLHTLYIIPVVIGSLWLWRQNILNKHLKHLWVYFIIAHILLVISTWKFTVQEFDHFFKLIPMALDRFLWFIPLFWIIQIGVISDLIIFKKPKLQKLFVGLIILQTGIIVANHKLIVNHEGPSFKEYYSEKLFQKIEQDLNEDKTKFRVLNVGIEPAIAQYNGFYTLGGFSGNYSLAYKHKFHKVITNELFKENGWPIRRKFELWGSMCYAYSQEFGLQFGEKYWKPINHLDFDWSLAQEMGVKYVFTPSEINLKNNPRLELFKDYTGLGYYYPLKVYKIKPK